MRKKDVHGETWPILGICQGLEVIAVLLNQNKLDVLDTIQLYGENRATKWTANHKNTLMWKDFPSQLITQMTTNPIGLHYHTYSIDLNTYKKIGSLNTFMRVIQTDTITHSDGTQQTFINAMEANNYPISAIMYHPEY